SLPASGKQGYSKRIRSISGRDVFRRRHQPRRPPPKTRPDSPVPTFGIGTLEIGGDTGPPTLKPISIVSPVLPPAPSQLMNRLSPETKAVTGVQGVQCRLVEIWLTEPKELP